jgi:hypothetical protein
MSSAQAKMLIILDKRDTVSLKTSPTVLANFYTSQAVNIPEVARASMFLIRTQQVLLTDGISLGFPHACVASPAPLPGSSSWTLPLHK